MFSVARQFGDLMDRDKLFLALVKQIGIAVSSSDTLAEAIQRCLDNICRHLQWPVGHAFVVNDQHSCMVSTGLWYLDPPEQYNAFKQLTENTSFAPGVGLPGKVMLECMPAWIPDMKDSN